MRWPKFSNDVHLDVSPSGCLYVIKVIIIVILAQFMNRVVFLKLQKRVKAVSCRK